MLPQLSGISLHYAGIVEFQQPVPWMPMAWNNYGAHYGDPFEIGLENGARGGMHIWKSTRPMLTIRNSGPIIQKYKAAMEQ